MNTPGIILHASGHDQLDLIVAAPTHAVLLNGPQGTGKTHVAVALSAELLKISPQELEHYAYFKVVKPTNGTISVEQIRELISFFRLKVPGDQNIKRATVVQDAETMTIEAQNALLKLLEEPPEDSILVLTSSQPTQLLTTVRSRLQQIQLPTPLEADIVKHFIAAGYPESSVRGTLLRNGTNIAATKHALEAATADGADTTISLVKQILGSSQYERLLLVDTLAKQKEQAHLFLDTLATIAITSLEAAAAKGAPTMPRWRDILQATYTAQGAFEHNGNAKLVLTELMLAL